MDLFYQKIGKGPVLIILHGLYGMSDNWISFARQLSSSFTIYLVDQRNHGRSPHDAEHSYRSMSLDLHSFILKEEIEKAIILGHSMGGKTAMLYALSFPEKVAGLIIVDIAPVNYSSVDSYSSQVITHLNIVNSMLSVDFTKMTSRVDIDDELEKTIKDESVRQFIMKNILRRHDGTFGWKLNIDAIAKGLPDMMNFPQKEVMANSNLMREIPVLFIRGGKSEYIIPEYYTEMKVLFPSAEIETVPNAGHWVHAEQPQLFMDKVRFFLGNNNYEFSL